MGVFIYWNDTKSPLENRKNTGFFILTFPHTHLAARFAGGEGSATDFICR
jgi:hypothetical protein